MSLLYDTCNTSSFNIYSVKQFECELNSFQICKKQVLVYSLCNLIMINSQFSCLFKYNVCRGNKKDDIQVLPYKYVRI